MESRPGTEVGLLKIKNNNQSSSASLSGAGTIRLRRKIKNGQIKAPGNANLINFWWIITEKVHVGFMAPSGRRPPPVTLVAT